jgi:hypothetical protein
MCKRLSIIYRRLLLYHLDEGDDSETDAAALASVAAALTTGSSGCTCFFTSGSCGVCSGAAA